MGPFFAALPSTAMTENDYLLAWGAYAVAALGCLLVWFQLTGWMWRWLREPLRLLVAVLLLTPTVVDPGKDALAPAIAIVAMDLLLKVGDNAWRATADLFSYGLLAFGAYLAFVLVRWPIEGLLRRRQPAAAPPAVRAKGRAGAAVAAPASAVDDGMTWTDPNGDRRLRIEPRL